MPPRRRCLPLAAGYVDGILGNRFQDLALTTPCRTSCARRSTSSSATPTSCARARTSSVPPRGNRIRASALELLRLVEDTMTAARLEAGRVPVRADDFAAHEVIEELAESVRALPEAKGEVAVRWAADPALPPLRLDHLKQKEIIQNLVSNALKYTPEGEVCVSLERDDDRLRIAVADTGVGIAAEAQARIFDMFERVEAADGRRPPGVGLGLYIVHRLVHLMQGTIELESAPGAGARFTVRLPLRLDATR